MVVPSVIAWITDATAGSPKNMSKGITTLSGTACFALIDSPRWHKMRSAPESASWFTGEWPALMPCDFNCFAIMFATMTLEPIPASQATITSRTSVPEILAIVSRSSKNLCEQLLLQDQPHLRTYRPLEASNRQRRRLLQMRRSLEVP